MNIETQIQGDRVILKVSGRLDAAWAEHFHNAVRENVREGRHHVRIDASGLEYLSSAGIRSLLRSQRELSAIKGSFGIIRASAFVAETLRLSGLNQLLLPDSEPALEEVPRRDAAAATLPTTEPSVAGIRFETHVLKEEGRISVRACGDWKPWQTVSGNAVSEVSFPSRVFGLGIGAPGKDLDAVRGQFGEFAAAGGCLAWLPGDGADNPDYIEQTGQFVPALQVIQSLCGEGDFSHLLRFSPDGKGACLSMSELVKQVFQTTRANAVAVVCLAEVEGLVGAALARSPGIISGKERPGDFPELRNWISFCGERLHRQSQALVVGFFSADPAHASLPQLSPMPSKPGMRGHAHAVVLPFRPLPQGALDLEQSVRSAFDDNEPIGILHLIEDDRSVIGLGQSAFIRGACWCAPFQFDSGVLAKDKTRIVGGTDI